MQFLQIRYLCIIMVREALPIGIQDFSKLIERDFVYVDKTEYYHRLITGGKYYSLSRPRHFGKSLLISTLKEIFLGNRALFKGLWIEEKHDWEPHPVILLDFTQISKRAPDLEEGIRQELVSIADGYGVRLTGQTNAGRLLELIQTLGKEKKVAVLVDEYDKPLIDHLEDPERVKQNRQVLKDMYSVLKGNDRYITFLMLTGVTKFSQVSIFSDLNHLTDITLTPAFSQMLGYTHEEIQRYFPAHLAELKAKWAGVFPDVMAEMKAWYNGYSWDAEKLVYNPFSVLNLFFNNEFGEYWFATGTPTFLVKWIRSRAYSIFDVENSEIKLRALSKFEIEDIEVNSLLFQTGYLTIRKKDPLQQTVTLGFPNKEVANAFSANLLAEFSEKGAQKTDTLVLRMAAELRKGNVEAFVESLRALFAGIAYPIQPAGSNGIKNFEKYYHTMFYLVLKLLGYDVQAEVLTHTGRIDAVVTTESYRYIFEFKLGHADEAMAQIKAKAYHTPYLTDAQQLFLVGIGFDIQTRNVSDYLVEALPER